ncbi:hypothetical protein [Anaerococcus sp. mt242]|uniref:CD0519/CD1768 family membrane protein n=1 Tax=unclassified Anaerococcus TaxID=2614126 RepID=UPI00193272F6|nr:hypothetical protein [Anaerococcus sp. mt242]MBM0045533.1 hypothetical protein [Anaerococcus sp. mt242]
MNKKYVKKIGAENWLFALIFFGIFASIGRVMGVSNMISTMMNGAYDLLINTCLFIMAISVLTGALSAIFSEFGFISLVDLILSKIMKPIYNLPGAASLGIINCYLSDNPSILPLAHEDNFKALFKKYQLPSLTNLGTSFGMGLIVTTTLGSLPLDGAGKAALIGTLGAFIGSIASVRIMQIFTKKVYNTEEMVEVESLKDIPKNTRVVRDGSFGRRFIEALLDGGKTGVDMGLSIIPGVIGICTIIMLLTNSVGPNGVYTGAANEGVPVLPWIGDKLSFILNPLFGFSHSESIAVPITALGSAGASMGLVKNLVADNLATANDLAVFTSICMCWSGYLSTHVAMMDAIGAKELTGPAILSHTIGGIVAGISAHLIFTLL